MYPKRYLRSYAEISLKAIAHNIDETRKRLPEGTRLLSVVKANAYGHGAVRVASYLEEQKKADYFAVATVEEGKELREHGIRTPILILAYTSPIQYPEIIEASITPTIYNLEEAKQLSRYAETQQKKVPIHIALDTGMTRIGFQVTEEDADQIAAIQALPGIFIEGLFTHLSCCDQEDKTYCFGQFQKYDQMLSWLTDRQISIPIRHVYNSAAAMEFDRDEPHHYDMVRDGITEYGCYPSDQVQKQNLQLIPALSWRAHVIHVKDVAPGIGVGYGATYVTHKENTRIATVSIGYADGYPRALSSRGRVLIRGQYAPIIGRICMDQMMVDVTDIPGVRSEDVVTLVGRDGDNAISIEEIADPVGSFNYEMLCRITPRVARLYDIDEDLS